MRMQRILCSVALMFLAFSLLAADSHTLAGVTVTDIKPDLANMRVSYTITNGTNSLVTAWGVEILSIFQGDSIPGYVSIDAQSAPRTGEHYAKAVGEWISPDRMPLSPGESRKSMANLRPVPLKESPTAVGPQLDVNPTSADVKMNVVIFEDNRAYGNERDILFIERIRTSNLQEALADLAVIDKVSKADDALAYVEQFLAGMPKPEPPTVVSSSSPSSRAEANRKDAEAHLYHTVSEIHRLLAEGTNVSDVLGLVGWLPKVASQHLEGHTQLIRAQR